MAEAQNNYLYDLANWKYYTLRFMGASVMFTRCLLASVGVLYGLT